MSLFPNRRSVLAGTAAFGAAALLPGARGEAAGGDWQNLVALARARAGRPYDARQPVFAPFRAGEAVFLADAFRAPGDPGRFGAAAGIFAVGRGAGEAFEWPTFRSFQAHADGMLALLDSPAVCAAARLRLGRGGRDIRIDARLFLREEVGVLAMAPCSAFAGAALREADALTISAAGNPISHPLREPARRSVSRFQAVGLGSFGLSASPEIAPAGDRPPSMLVTADGSWGEGNVVLVEEPAVDEFCDNVVAAFVPRRTFAAGDTFAYRYALDWTAAVDAPRIT
jgi:glucans biosynthesis protein